MDTRCILNLCETQTNTLCFLFLLWSNREQAVFRVAPCAGAVFGVFGNGEKCNGRDEMLFFLLEMTIFAPTSVPHLWGAKLNNKNF